MIEQTPLEKSMAVILEFNILDHRLDESGLTLGREKHWIRVQPVEKECSSYLFNVYRVDGLDSQECGPLVTTINAYQYFPWEIIKALHYVQGQTYLL